MPRVAHMLPLVASPDPEKLAELATALRRAGVTHVAWHPDGQIAILNLAPADVSELVQRFQGDRPKGTDNSVRYAHVGGGDPWKNKAAG